MTRSLNVTATKSTEQQLVVRVGKSEAAVTNTGNKRGIVLLEANYREAQSIAQPLCDSRATCSCWLPVCYGLLLMFLQENPRQSRCLGVFGLSLYTQERDLREVFEHYGPIEDLQIVYDHQSGRSRGFAFLYMRNYEDAVEVSVCSLSESFEDIAVYWLLMLKV